MIAKIMACPKSDAAKVSLRRYNLSRLSEMNVNRFESGPSDAAVMARSCQRFLTDVD